MGAIQQAALQTFSPTAFLDPALIGAAPQQAFATPDIYIDPLDPNTVADAYYAQIIAENHSEPTILASSSNTGNPTDDHSMNP